MNKVNEHPSDSELNLLLDGELSPSRSAELAQHLAACQECSARHAALADVSQLVRQAAPAPAECCSEGAFWVQLASHLKEHSDREAAPAPYPWLRLVPTFILAALGGLLDLSLTAVLIAYTMINLGILPNIGSQLLANFQQALPSSGFVALLAKLGITNAAALQNMLAALTSGGLTGNEVALYFLLIALSVILAFVVAMLLLWNMPRITGEQNLRRVNAHAVR